MLRADDLGLHIQYDKVSACVHSGFHTLRRLCWEGHGGLGQGQLAGRLQFHSLPLLGPQYTLCMECRMLLPWLDRYVGTTFL